ncbi:MAG: right-handed parallel beta-helix repeat-containing protein [Myxococcota bacterium]
MRHCGLALALAALLLALAPRAFAVERHVSPTGNDGAAGSLALPYRTLRHALDRAGPGDTIYLHAGTYPEAVSTNDGAIRGGTSWSNALVIASYPGDMVVLAPPAGTHRVLMFASAQASYVVVRGLVLDARNVRYEGVKITWSSSKSNSSHHVRIEDSEVVGAPGQGVLVTGHHNEFLRLRVHRNGVTDFDHGFYIASPDNLIDGCEVFDNAGWGVSVFNGHANESDRNIVRNNRIHHNARAGRRGAGIILSSGDDNVAINNVIYGNKIGIHVDYGSLRARVYNNTIFAQATDGIHVGAGASDTDVRNNLVFDSVANFTNAGRRTTTGTNLFGGNPGVVDAARFDAHLLASSAAIDQGTTLDTVPFDHDQVPRPQGAAYDVGAYEYPRLAPPILQPISE